MRWLPPHMIYRFYPANRKTVSLVLNSLSDTSNTAAGTLKKEIQQLGEDILPIHTDAVDLTLPFASLSKGWLFWLALVGPLSLYLMLLVALRVQRLSPERLAQSRTKKAFSTFKAALPERSNQLRGSHQCLQGLSE